jgi:hypothetical protein
MREQFCSFLETMMMRKTTTEAEVLLETTPF